jgi:hypothetical protein
MSNREITVPPRRAAAARKLATDWRAFTKLMAECDGLIEEHKFLNEQLRELRERKPGEAPDLDIDDAKLDDDTKATIERCKQALELFDRPEHYEDNDNEEGALRSEVIADRLALMLGCVDTGPTNTEPEAFARMMVTHVADAGIMYPALLSGCKAIEQGTKPVRSIGQVLEMLLEHNDEWHRRRGAVYWIGNTAGTLRNALVEAHGKLLLEQAEQKVERQQRLYDNHAKFVEHRREGCEKEKQAAIEAHRKYQQSRRSLIDEEQRLREHHAKLDAMKADLAKLLPPPSRNA